jgi:hypothetical protein
MSEKDDKLQEVFEAAEYYRESQANTARARERFVDSIMDAKAAKATQYEIAERCVIEPDNPTKHLSRQRVAQFIDERRKNAA